LAHILRLAPAGTGKTTRLLALLRDLTQSERGRLPKIWVLLATRRQALNFRHGLAELDKEVSVYSNIEFFNFYSLNARLLKSAGAPVRRLNNMARLGLLRQLLGEMQTENQLEFFQRIADTRGFVSIVAGLIDELKQAGVDVADFAAAARNDKEEEIARIYRRYQATLKRSDLADVEGEGWLALAKLRERPKIASDVDLLVVDGYDQFTLVQAQLLAALARAIDEIHITLTDLPSANAEALPHRSARARQTLGRAFANARLHLNVVTIAPDPNERSADLERLSQRVFRDHPAASGGDAIQMIAMPNPAEEVRSVLRRIKRQLLEGVLPDDILVAIRDWNRYATHFETAREEYDLPLLLHFESELRQAPVIAVLIDLLGMAPQFRRRDLLDVLRSPYIDSGLEAEQIDRLDRISMERQFLGGGAADWLDMVNRASRSVNRYNEDAPRAVLTVEQREALFLRLSAFFDGVTPAGRADTGAYVDWLEGLLGDEPLSESPSASSQFARNSFSLNSVALARQHNSGNDEITRRDLAALAGLKRVLRDMAANDDVLRATFGETAETDWRQFWSDLKHALETTVADPFYRSRAGQVLVTTASEARGLPHRHVYILGLAEGVFPAAISEDPFFLDSERENLKENGIQLATQAERIDDQGLFYEIISLPRDSLTLSRPTFQAGKVWIESHLWRAVRRVYPELKVESSAVGSVVDPEEAASGAETLLGVASSMNAKRMDDAKTALRIRNWLRSDAALATQWQRIEAGRRVELGRLSSAPFDRYSGVLANPDLLSEIASRLGHDRVWSATQLKDYGLCGFRFFAKRLLKLEQIEEPEAGFDAARLGSLNHRILEETYREFDAQALKIDEDNLEAALDIFARAAEDILERAPELFNFRATATWQAEKQVLRNRLAAFIRQDFSPESPLSRFGDGRYVHELELHLTDVQIELAAGRRPLRVKGYIDRIDLIDGKLVVIDYKSGATAISRREMEIGRDFQMMIYMLALRSYIKQMGKETEITGGLFWRLRNLKASGLHVEGNEDDDAAIEMARQHIARNLEAGRAGQFPARATALENGKCARYCEFSRLCRMRVTSQFKQTPPV